jgi:hypothetical protein
MKKYFKINLCSPNHWRKIDWRTPWLNCNSKQRHLNCTRFLPKWRIEPFQTLIWGYTYIISGKKQFIIEQKLLFLEGSINKNEKIHECNIPILWRALNIMQTCIFDRKSWRSVSKDKWYLYTYKRKQTWNIRKNCNHWAGFAGLRLAQDLENTAYDVLLIDKNNYHQFQPLMYQVATARLEPASISFRWEKYFNIQKMFVSALWCH